MLLETELDPNRNRSGAAACTFGGTQGKRSPGLRPRGRNGGQEAWRPSGRQTQRAEGKGVPETRAREGTRGKSQGPGALPLFLGDLGAWSRHLRAEGGPS